MPLNLEQFDPHHEAVYQQLLEEEGLENRVLDLLDHDTQRPSTLAIRDITTETISTVVTGAIEHHLSLLALGLYRRAIPELENPTSLQPAFKIRFRKGNPYPLLIKDVHGRVEDARFETLPVDEETIVRARIPHPEEIRARNVAHLSLKAQLRCGGQKIPGEVRTILAIREGMLRPSLVVKSARDPQTTEAIKQAKVASIKTAEDTAYPYASPASASDFPYTQIDEPHTYR